MHIVDDRDRDIIIEQSAKMIETEGEMEGLARACGDMLGKPLTMECVWRECG
jgi:hypothetical protein